MDIQQPFSHISNTLPKLAMLFIALTAMSVSTVSGQENASRPENDSKASNSASSAATDQDISQQAITQILVYDDEKLVSQGSGVILADGGLVLASAHIVEAGDEVVIKTLAGQRSIATIVYSDKPTDLAVLNSQSPLRGIPLAKRAVNNGDTYMLRGFWSDDIEEERSTFFSRANTPQYVATEHPQGSNTTVLVTENTKSEQKLAGSFGRGGYGAAVLNRCGELVGLVTPNPGIKEGDRYLPHMPTGTELLDTDSLIALADRVPLQPRIAEEICLTAKEQALEEERAEFDTTKSKAEEEARKAKETARKAEEEAKSAAQEADKEREAKSAIEEEKRQISDIAAEVNSQLDEITSEKQTLTGKYSDLVLIAIGAAIAAIVLVAVLVIKRRRDLKKANQRLSKASATFSDCRFEGTNSAGAPLAFHVLGKDLMQRQEGLVVGRNPDYSQVVIADDTVSREHARLFVKDSHLHIKDLNSTGGTRINGMSAQPDGSPVISGDRIEFGEVHCVLTLS